MKRFKAFSAAFIVAVMFMVGAGVASAQSPTNPGFPERINPSSEFCGQQGPRNLGACAAGLSQQYRSAAGLNTTPKYLYVRYAGVSQVGWGANGPVACAFHESVTLYCNGSVHLGENTLKDIASKLPVNPEAYATFLAAHEATHHTQTTTGGTNLFPIFTSSKVQPFEQQADCVGGAAIGYWVMQGRFSETDASELQVQLRKSPTTTTHASGDKRAAAFETGYRSSSLNDCIGGAFAPTPLV